MDNYSQSKAAFIKRKLSIITGRTASYSFSSFTIYKVPKRFKMEDSTLFQPQVISIGPYYHDQRKNQLQAMEKQKWRYLEDFLYRINNEDFLERSLLEEVERRARGCYSEEIPLDSDSFVEMLVLDACFIVELFRKAQDTDHASGTDELRCLMPAIAMDLLLVENQIPLFFLQTLYTEIVAGRKPSYIHGNYEEVHRALFREASTVLQRDALNFFKKFHFFDTLISKYCSPFWTGNEFGHLLDLFHWACIAGVSAKKSGEVSRGYVKMIRSATEISKAGINFKRREKPRHFLDIKFKNGEIEMPFLTVDGLSYTTLVNLMAFEQWSAHKEAYFTSYAYLMDCLIDTPWDVEILSKNGIIDHWLGSNEAAATLFNNIGIKMALDAQNFYFCEHFEQINHYCGRAWPRFMVSLRRDYFKNPWTIISTIAAVILIFLTCTQTFFSAFPTFAHHP